MFLAKPRSIRIRFGCLQNNSGFSETKMHLGRNLPNLIKNIIKNSIRSQISTFFEDESYKLKHPLSKSIANIKAFLNVFFFKLNVNFK